MVEEWTLVVPGIFAIVSSPAQQGFVEDLRDASGSSCRIMDSFSKSLFATPPAMDKEEALSLLKDFLDQLESAGYETLSARVGENDALEVTGPSGKPYQIEYDIVWDHKPPHGDIRILGSVDDGGLRAFAPLTDSRLVPPPSR